MIMVCDFRRRAEPVLQGILDRVVGVAAQARLAGAYDPVRVRATT